ncbi:hypothetical protein SAMN04488034_10924 [Salinimicrobium catena]|uniref:Uncharacterized protein n=1 Tax=Salinimicrobium catena TaxID=390640 RepID=A0A1H5P581_9FLAO|nr:hypothetical protein [Salinimicrobium catena]SDL71989.1 hypothetical protein SAMN04488140_10958 [Salinimicrobium catena]SEF09036.1 hypothetical protein SAMN04488034_10924 [Salinimicrobium catena]
MKNNSFTARDFFQNYYKELSESRYPLDPTFLKENYRKFIRDYEFFLTEFVGDQLTMNPDQKDFIEIEKAFILILLEELKKRHLEIENIKEEIIEEYLQLNNIPKSEVPWFKNEDPHALEWDSYMQHKEEIEVYEMNHEKIGKETWLEFYSYRGKVLFLRIKANRLGYEFSNEENIAFQKIEKEVEVPSPEYHNTTGTQKLLFLQELGLIDYLKQINPSLSTNKLAKVLGAITGERYLQPALNAMQGEQKFKDKKSPYYSKKNLPRVKDQLIQWGFTVTSGKD